MLRFLALLLLAFLVAMALRALVSNLRLAGRRSAGTARNMSGATTSRPAGEHLVRCDRCGVRFPATRALPGPPVPGGPVPGRFCSVACRDGGPDAGSRERTA